MLEKMTATREEAKNEKRNVLVESARIARGAIKDIAEVKADDLDAREPRALPPLLRQEPRSGMARCRLSGRGSLPQWLGLRTPLLPVDRRCRL